MAVIVGSARIDENGNARGGSAGDQTGKEVSTQNWYKHSKGWRVLRANDNNVARKIAACMKSACANSYIGYDQGQRLTLYNTAKPFGFDCAQVKTKCETDCSALVRVCLAYAGVMVSNFNTTTQAKVMLASGAFVELEGAKYTDSSDYLKAGDVLVTKTQGHTVVVLTDGPKAANDNVSDEAEPTISRGDKGENVRKLQKMLISCGYSCGEHGADGSFGSDTENAVKAFQTAKELDVSGIYNQETHEKLMEAYKNRADAPKKYVLVTGANVNVRASSSTAGKILGTVKKGTELTYAGKTAANGWHNIVYNGHTAWITGLYTKLIG